MLQVPLPDGKGGIIMPNTRGGYYGNTQRSAQVLNILEGLWLLLACQMPGVEHKMLACKSMYYRTNTIETLSKKKPII